MKWFWNRQKLVEELPVGDIYVGIGQFDFQRGFICTICHCLIYEASLDDHRDYHLKIIGTDRAPSEGEGVKTCRNYKAIRGPESA